MVGGSIGLHDLMAELCNIACVRGASVHTPARHGSDTRP